MPNVTDSMEIVAKSAGSRLRELTCGLALACASTVAPFIAHATIPVAERQALIGLYNASAGDGWVQNANWCSGVCPASGTPTFNAAGTECTWYGIACDSEQAHVIAIALANNNLAGTLPALGALSDLEYFNVASNQLGGSIPVLSGLSQLQTFYADDNQLTGSIPSLSGLIALGDFSVQHNQLSGSLPNLSGLNGLYSFAASGNQLTGNLPSLAGLSSLQSFEAGANNITGTIPSLSGLTNLLELTVDHNQLTGSILNLSGSTRLIHVDFGANRLTGTVPVVPAGLYTPLAYWPSALCANPLSTTPGANDAGWDSATGNTPWYATPYSNNTCDDIFTNTFEVKP